MSRLEEVSNLEKARLGSKSVQPERPGAQILDIPTRKVDYQAFGAPTNDPQLRLIIYTKGMFLMPRYDLLMDVVWNGRYDFIGLVFTHQRVRIHGRNLTNLVFSLRLHCAEWIREYVESHHQLPNESTPAVITDIQIEGGTMGLFDKDMWK